MALFPKTIFDVGYDTDFNFEDDDDVEWLDKPILPNIYRLKIYYPINHYSKWYLGQRHPILYSIVEYKENEPITPRQVLESVYEFYQTKMDPAQFKQYQDYLWNYNPDEEAEETDEPIYLHLLAPGMGDINMSGLVPHFDGYTLEFI